MRSNGQQNHQNFNQELINPLLQAQQPEMMTQSTMRGQSGMPSQSEIMNLLGRMVQSEMRGQPGMGGQPGMRGQAEMTMEDDILSMHGQSQWQQGISSMLMMMQERDKTVYLQQQQQQYQNKNQKQRRESNPNQNQNRNSRNQNQFGQLPQINEQQFEDTQQQEDELDANIIKEDVQGEEIILPPKDFKFTQVKIKVQNDADYQAQYKMSVNPHLIQQIDSKLKEQVQQERLALEKKFFMNEYNRRNQSFRSEEQVKFDTTCDNLKQAYFKQFRQEQFLNPFVQKLDNNIKIWFYKKKDKQPIFEIKSSHISKTSTFINLNIEKVIESFNSLAQYTYCQNILEEIQDHFNSIFYQDSLQSSNIDDSQQQEKQKKLSIFTFYERLINLSSGQYVTKGKISIKGKKQKVQKQSSQQIEQQEKLNILFEKAIIERFIYITEKQTKAKLQTIGLIYGIEQDIKIENEMKQIMLGDTLIIPEQQHIQNGCKIINQEQCDKQATSWNRKKLVGWIITHPTQDQFMYSYDLHQQYNYQSKEPDFDIIGIVYAPKREITLQGYILSDPGINEIGKCQQTNLHDSHTNNSHKLVEKFMDFKIIKDLNFKVQTFDFMNA